MSLNRIEWRRPCPEGTVHYGYYNGSKYFYLTWDPSLPEYQGRWKVKLDYELPQVEILIQPSLQQAQAACEKLLDGWIAEAVLAV